jgi:hypothetical protein
MAGAAEIFYLPVLARDTPFVSSTTLVTAPELDYRREPQIGNLRNKPASKEERNESLTALGNALRNATIAAVHAEEELNAHALKQRIPDPELWKFASSPSSEDGGRYSLKRNREPRLWNRSALKVFTHRANFLVPV